MKHLSPFFAKASLALAAVLIFLIPVSADLVTIDVTSGETSDARSFTSSNELVKTGAGTLILNNTSSDHVAITSVTVNGGVLRLFGQDYGWHGDTEGYFGKTTPITVNSGAELQIYSRANVNRNNAVTINGGTLTFNDEDYLNNLTLKNGATVKDGVNVTDSSRFWRVQGGTITLEATGVTNEPGSEISAGICFVSGGGNKATFNVADTTAAVDLNVSGKIFDHDSGLRGTVVTKTGAGTLRLSNNSNSWYAGTSVEAGTVELAAANASGAGAIAIGSDSGARLVLVSAASGGTGTYNVAGLTGTGLVTGTATLNLGSNATSSSFSGQFDPNVSLVKVGSKEVELKHANGNGIALANAVEVKEGTLTLNGSGFSPTGSEYGYFGTNRVNVSGTGTLKVGAWNLQNSPVTATGEEATINFASDSYANNITLNDGAKITGSSVYRVGFFGGGKPITLTVGGTGTGSEVASGKFMLVTDGDARAVNTVTIAVADTGASVSNKADLLISSPVVDHPAPHNGMKILKTGAGTMELNNGSNTWIGGIEVQGGKVKASVTNALATGPVYLNGEATALELTAGTSESIGNLSGTGNVLIAGSSADPTVLTVGSANSDATFSGSLAAGTTLVKTGSGTWTLNRVLGNGNAITSFTMNQGKVILNGNPQGNWSNEGYFRYAPVTVNAGAELVAAALMSLHRSSTVTVDGGTLTFAGESYASNLILKNGAIVQQNNDTSNSIKKWRSQKLVTIGGETGSTITADLCLVKQGSLESVTFDVGDTGSAVDLTFAGLIHDHPNDSTNTFTGMSIVKTGAGTMRFTRNGGNYADGYTNITGTVKIQGGTVELAGGGIDAVSYGYFRTPVEVSNGAVLKVQSYGNINKTPLTISGEDSSLEINAVTYANSVTLTDGADVTIGSSGQYRAGYISAPKLTVTGTGTGSEISGSQMYLVKDGDYNMFTIDVSETGASASGKADLTISARISDLPDSTSFHGMTLMKTGAGTLELTNTNNSFIGSVIVQEGTLLAASPSVLGTSATSVAKKLTVSSGAIVDFADSATWTGSYELAGTQDIQLTVTDNGDGALSFGADTQTFGGTLLVSPGAKMDMTVEGLTIDKDNYLDWQYLADNPVELLKLADGGTLDTGSAQSIPVIFPSEMFGNVPDLRLSAVWNAETASYETQVGVPEPSSIILILLGLTGLTLITRRRTR